MNRRTYLRLGGLAAAGSLAGCAALSSAPPDVETNTGLDRDPSDALEETPVHLAGETDDLPELPTTAEALAHAEVALATPDATIAPLADAFREGTTVAFAGGGSQEALAALLDAVRGEYDYGIETVKGRPVGVSVAEPRGDAANTFQFVREGGWPDPVLDPVGWALDARLPDCETFVPESTADDQYVRAGSAWIAGRLQSGETYAARTRASRHTDSNTRRLRLRTAMHAAANGGYAIAEAGRVADFPNDEGLTNWFPNPHEQNGVEVTNHSNPIEERLDVSFSPAGDDARGALTGCCGLTTDGEYAYDHRTRWIWTDDGLLGSESRYGGGSGRGEWHVRD
jgi:hypothetical protein